MSLIMRVMEKVRNRKSKKQRNRKYRLESSQRNRHSHVSNKEKNGTHQRAVHFEFFRLSKSFRVSNLTESGRSWLYQE